MKTSPKLVFALLAVASCAASAQTYSSQADQERRERNREEALANYRAHGDSATVTTRERRESAREEAREGKDKVRDDSHRVAESTRRVAHKTANEGRRVGHKIAEKARDSTDRANAKFGTVSTHDSKGEAQNPTGKKITDPNGPK